MKLIASLSQDTLIAEHAARQLEKGISEAMPVGVCLRWTHKLLGVELAGGERNLSPNMEKTIAKQRTDIPISDEELRQIKAGVPESWKILEKEKLIIPALLNKWDELTDRNKNHIFVKPGKLVESTIPAYLNGTTFKPGRGYLLTFGWGGHQGVSIHTVGLGVLEKQIAFIDVNNGIYGISQGADKRTVSDLVSNFLVDKYGNYCRPDFKPPVSPLIVPVTARMMLAHEFTRKDCEKVSIKFGGESEWERMPQSSAPTSTRESIVLHVEEQNGVIRSVIFQLADTRKVMKLSRDRIPDVVLKDLTEGNLVEDQRVSFKPNSLSKELEANARSKPKIP